MLTHGMNLFLACMKFKEIGFVLTMSMFLITGVNAAIAALKIWLGHVNLDVARNLLPCWQSLVSKVLRLNVFVNMKNTIH